MKTTDLRLPTLALALSAAFALGACSRDEGRTAGESLDAAIAQTQKAASDATTAVQQGATELKTEASSAADSARQTASETAQKADQAMDKAVGSVAATMTDAAITASVNAELAKDPVLNALRIDVDTRQGKVELRGTAPSATARDRATELARGVKGVEAVDNRLEVRG